jgi:hypothetical protein
MMGSMTQRFMTIDLDDFLRRLPAALATYRYELHDGLACVSLNQGRVQICWCASPALDLPLMTLPVLQVDLHFEQVSDQDARLFIHAFDKAYLRGGG